MKPSWTMVCLQTLQCFAFLKVFTRNVWEWRASNSSGCSQENNNKRQKRWNVSLKKKCCKLHWVQVAWVILLSGIFVPRSSFKTQMKSFYKLDNTESIKSNCKSYINPYIHLRSNPSSRGKSLQLSYLCLKTVLQSSKVLPGSKAVGV